MVKYKLLTALFVFLLMVGACSFNTPSVTRVRKERIYSETQQGSLSERLAVFILLEDTDGRNDYKELTLREDATGLQWTIYRENTVFLQEAGHSNDVQWVGSNKFKYPRRMFPAGSYTVCAFDLGGNKTEMSFSLQEPQSFSALPFEFTLQDEQWSLRIFDGSACSTVSFIMLTADLQPLTVYRIEVTGTAQSGTLQSLLDRSADARYIQCFCENTDRSAGFLSASVPLRQ